eukprot:1152621-Pelagomonas_calceolata.AAC.4
MGQPASSACPLHLNPPSLHFSADHKISYPKCPEMVQGVLICNQKRQMRQFGLTWWGPSVGRPCCMKKAPQLTGVVHSV